MRNSEKFLKTLSSLIENGILTSKDIQKEISTDLKFKKDKLISKLDLVSREEFEVLKKLVQKQEAAIKLLKKEVKKVKIFLLVTRYIYFFPVEYFLHENLLHPQLLLNLNQPLTYLNFYFYLIYKKV